MPVKSERPKPKTQVEFPSDREMVFTRVFDAPRELVYEAHTNPKHVINRWGPAGFTNSIQEMDVRPGGVWRLIMHGPDGTDYPNRITFLEVVKPSRLVYDHGDDANPKMFHVTTEFLDLGGKTKLVTRMKFKTAAECEETKKFALEGHESTMGRLDEYLAQVLGAKPLLITRVFDAPLDLVWKAHSDAGHLAKWWGPKGFEFKIGKLDFRPGGIFHYGMKGPNGAMMWGKLTYLEIVPKEKIVNLVAFSDEQGGLTRHPMSATWPEQTLSTCSFSEKDGKTALTLSWSAYHASTEEMKTFDAAHAGMNQGLKGTWDQLEAYLAEVEA